MTTRFTPHPKKPQNKTKRFAKAVQIMHTRENGNKGGYIVIVAVTKAELYPSIVPVAEIFCYHSVTEINIVSGLTLSHNQKDWQPVLT